MFVKILGGMIGVIVGVARSDGPLVQDEVRVVRTNNEVKAAFRRLAATRGL